MDDARSGRLAVGGRASVRYRLADGSATDVVGLIIAVNGDTATVQDRAGTQHPVPVSDIIIAKPLAPIGRGREPRRAAPAELQRAAAAAWHDQQEPLGEWLLRYASGVTFRANSVLAIGETGRSVRAAADAAVAYAQAHGIAPVAQVVLDSAEGQALHALDWRPFRDDVTVLAARVIDLCAQGPGTVRVGEQLTTDWAERYLAEHPGSDDEAALRLLRCGSPAFARTDRDGALVAIGRGNQIGDWAVVTALWTHPDHRRRGLMRDTVRSLAWWAGRRGARSLLLQVADRNTGALAAYERIGLIPHHRYRYLRPEH